MKRTILKLFCTVLSCLLLLCACEADESVITQATELGAVPLDGLQLEAVVEESAGFTYQYPTDDWFVDDTIPVVSTYIVYKETAGTEYPVNVNAQSAGHFAYPLTDTLCRELSEQLVQTQAVKIESSDVYLLDGKPVIFIESSFTFTNEVLDQLIDNGTYTEEFITASGGREMFLALPTTRNYLLYAKAGDTLIAIGGAYYEEGQREPLLNCMKIMAQTVSLTQE